MRLQSAGEDKRARKYLYGERLHAGPELHRLPHSGDIQDISVFLAVSHYDVTGSFYVVSEADTSSLFPVASNSNTIFSMFSVSFLVCSFDKNFFNCDKLHSSFNFQSHSQPLLSAFPRKKLQVNSQSFFAAE